MLVNSPSPKRWKTAFSSFGLDLRAMSIWPLSGGQFINSVGMMRGIWTTQELARAETAVEFSACPWIVINQTVGALQVDGGALEPFSWKPLQAKHGYKPPTGTT